MCFRYWCPPCLPPLLAESGTRYQCCHQVETCLCLTCDDVACQCIASPSQSPLPVVFIASALVPSQPQWISQSQSSLDTMRASAGSHLRKVRTREVLEHLADSTKHTTTLWHWQMALAGVCANVVARQSQTQRASKSRTAELDGLPLAALLAIGVVAGAIEVPRKPIMTSDCDRLSTCATTTLQLCDVDGEGCNRVVVELTTL